MTPPIVLEGNGSRPSHHGRGWDESGVSPTLNEVERHAVFCIGTWQSDISTHITREKMQTLNTLNARQLIYEEREESGGTGS